MNASTPQLSPITLTQRAADHICKFLKNNDAHTLRISIKPTGCSGYSYVVNIAEQLADSDHTFEAQGVKITIDDDSIKYLNGSEIDYVREGLNEGFKFNNPNVAATCGCGESFNI